MKYCDKGFHVEFKEFPSLIPVILKTQFKDASGFIGILRAWQGASVRRYFKLKDDWHITIKLNEDDYDNENLSGQIVIPISYKQSQTLLDGASVPLPWLVSFLSFGLLRPLGVMLTASIVHDFAFKHGGLLYLEDDCSKTFKPLPRHLADQLFRDIIRTVNGMPVTALLGWLAVRLGWFFVKYADKPRGEKFPVIAVVVLIIILSILGGSIWFFGLETVITCIALFYLLMFVLLKVSAHFSQNQA